jgi:phosphate-selective porin
MTAAGRTSRYGWLAALAVACSLAAVPIPVAGQQSSLSLGPDNGITFSPGLRVQTRYVNDESDGNNDFYTARVRLKGGGNAFGIATYYTEVKVDGTGRFAGSASAQIENAWLRFDLKPDMAFRVGFGDATFSRDALTSDSKLLQIDRSMIKDSLASVGFADNTIGMVLHGRPMEGRLEYYVGLFDNLAFEGSGGRQADELMTQARVVYNFLDPAPARGFGDYRSSYVGEGQRLAIGLSAGRQGNALQGATRFDLTGWGSDVFFNTGPVSAQAEYGRYSRALDGGGDASVSGGFVQAGFLVTPKLELNARYQQLDPDSEADNDLAKWSSVGANYYLRGHNLKVQTDFTHRTQEGSDVSYDRLQIQLQLDF